MNPGRAMAANPHPQTEIAHLWDDEPAATACLDAASRYLRTVLNSGVAIHAFHAVGPEAVP